MSSSRVLWLSVVLAGAAGACGQPVSSSPGELTYVPGTNPGSGPVVDVPTDGNLVIDTNMLLIAGLRSFLVGAVGAPGRCLEARDTSTVGVAPCTGGRSQRWVVSGGQLMSGAGTCLSTPVGAAADANIPALVPCAQAPRWTAYGQRLNIVATATCLWLSPSGGDYSVRLAACNDADPNTHWALNIGHGLNVLAQDANDLCLASQADGPALQPCKSAAPYLWTLDFGEMRSQAKCLSGANGTSGQMAPCDKSAAQAFYLSGGNVRVLNQSTCLRAAASTAGATTVLGACDSSSAAQWSVSAPVP